MVFSKKSALGWISALTIVLVWMFVLGVLVGRGTVSIEQFRAQKIAEEIEKGKVTGKIGPRYSEKLPENLELDFYRDLKTSEAPPLEKRKSVKKSGKKVVPPPERKAPARREVPPLPERKTVPEMGQEGGYSIQVAALKEKGVALSTVEKLRKQGYHSYVAKGRDKKGTLWFRIRIGSYKSRQEATETLRRLKSEKMDAFLVNK